MLSRVADSIYWLSRYVERTENVARFIDVNLNLSLDLPLDDDAQWQPLVDTTGDQDDFDARYGAASGADVMHFLTFDRQNPNSILACVEAARFNARTVRDAISSEMWEQLNTFYLMVRRAEQSGTALGSPHAFYKQVKDASHLFCGLCDTTMPRDEAWHFAQLGRLLERADKTARILDVKYFILLPAVKYVGGPYDAILWAALLKSASGLEMYRRLYPEIKPETVAEFMILRRTFPRSIRHCLIHAENALRAITGSGAGTFTNPAEQRLGRLRAELDYAPIGEIIAGGLHEYLDALQGQLNAVGEAIYQSFIQAAPVIPAPPNEPDDHPALAPVNPAATGR